MYTPSSKPDPQISVIIPTFGKRPAIFFTLESLAKQTMPLSTFEIVIVINSVQEYFNDALNRIRMKYPQLNINVYRSTVTSLGAARNCGLIAAHGEYITFVDDDDAVESNYLQSLYEAVEPRVIAVTSIKDRAIDEKEDREQVCYRSELGLRLRAFSAKKLYSAAEAAIAASFNVCKMVHRDLLSTHRFDPDLESGEDTVFWAEVFCSEDFSVRFIGRKEDTDYIRTIGGDSVSRQETSFDFNVVQRLEVMKRALNIRINALWKKKFINNLLRRQSSFANNFITEYPEEYARVRDAYCIAGIDPLIAELNAPDDAEMLAFLYCFAPFSDTSAIVASKVLASFDEKVDVISCDMSAVRAKDVNINRITNHLVRHQHIIATPASFTNWRHGANFGIAAVKAAENMQMRQGKRYKKVYSRALWTGSHVAGALYKHAHPDVVWTAEFSDPTTHTADGSVRISSAGYGRTWNLFISKIQKIEPLYRPRNMYDLIEYATVVLADELIFTNPNQLEFMMRECPFQSIAQLMNDKAIIRPHPEPLKEAYQLSPSSIAPRHDKINIAYFGNFYKNRNLGEIFDAIASLDADEQKKLRIWVFASTRDELDAYLDRLDSLQAEVIISRFLPYLEMLNTCTKMDVLIVNDAVTEGLMPINPYLPSKVSDYRGSGADIWALSEPGSVMSAMKFDYQSTLGDVTQTQTVLKMIISHIDQEGS